MTKENIEGLNRLLEFYLEVKPTLKPLPKLLDGDEVMQILGMKPSKELGDVLNALHEEQICGNINTKEDAVRFIKGYRK